MVEPVATTSVQGGSGGGGGGGGGGGRGEGVSSFLGDGDNKMSIWKTDTVRVDTDTVRVDTASSSLDPERGGRDFV